MLALAAPPAAASSPQVLYRFADHRIDEASGIGVGVRSPGVDYVQNDSGDTARFFAVDAANGRTAATITVPGATNVDWEDLAVAPAPGKGPPGTGPSGKGNGGGRSSVWLADIGDNDAVRSEIRVYRVDEPRITASARDRSVRSTAPDVWRLRYPAGATNAESFAVTPTGTGYLVTKSFTGSSVVYRLPPHPDREHVQTLVRVGSITFRARDTDTPIGTLGTLTATGAALSRDGSLLAVRTYSDAFVWRVRGDDVAAALRQAPTRVPLPVEAQGEGVTFDGRRLLVDSEGVGTPVYAVPLPASVLSPPALPTPLPTPNPSTLNDGSLPLTFASSSPAPGADGGASAGWLWFGGVSATLVVVAAAVTRRRRRAR